MGYNNNSYDFNYDLDVVIKDRKTGETITSFKARENEPITKDAGFEAGGIASGGHKYSISTNSQVYDMIKEWDHDAYVDGTKYRVMSKSYSNSTLRANFLKKSKKETIVYLG